MAEKTDADDDRLFAEANAWFHRLNSGEATPADQDAFAAWVGRGPGEARAWGEIQAFTLALRQSAHAVRGDRQQGDAEVRPGWRPRPRQALAAAIALLIVIGGYREAPVYWDRLRADYATGVGEQRQIALGDGSRVELNTDSAIRVDYAGGGRHIDLLRGEAWFEVRHDPARPFTVSAGRGETTDVGTRFDVMNRDDATTVSVAEGLVDVAENGASLRLKPGKSVDYGADGLSDIHDIDPSIAFAWRQGQIVFRQQPLSAVVAELNRYRTGRIVIVDPAIAGRVVSGVFEIDQPASAVDALRRTLGIGSISVTPYLVLLHR